MSDSKPNYIVVHFEVPMLVGVQDGSLVYHIRKTDHVDVYLVLIFED